MQTHIVQKIITSNEQWDTKKKLQSFLGLVNQERDYIPKLAENLKTITTKTKERRRIPFYNRDQTQIQKIKLSWKTLPKL